jgi:hypothetical protein
MTLMKDWLTTREAALRLTVSESSVRRWGDAGLVPVQRVGRRGERRFQEVDIRRLLERGLPSLRAPTEPARQPVTMFGRIPVALGSHLATFYDNDAARYRLTVPFLSEGLRHGQPCLLMAPDKVLDSYLRELGTQEGVDLDAAVSHGILAIASELGKTTDEASARWQELAWGALGRGSGILRVVGEMACALDEPSPPIELLRYEEGMNSVIKRFPAVAVCQYDVREFEGKAVLGAIKAHPDIFEVNLGRLVG